MLEQNPILNAEVPRINCDVLVVGTGISGLSAAISARENGAEVVVIEKAPIENRGGNTKFADAQIRYPHQADEFHTRNYTEDDYRQDFMHVTQGRANPELIEVIVKNAADTVDWLTYRGIEWEPGYPHTGGYRRSPLSGGIGLVNTLCRIAEGMGVAFSYQTAARQLIVDAKGNVIGCRTQTAEEYLDIYAKGGVILACGGFQANIQMRVAHLGRFADSLILRGSRYDTGEGILMALAIGAKPAGQWGDYHSAVLDARSPKEECGVTALYNYQMGIFVDQNGKRFLDEGEDYRDNTYVKFSKYIIDHAGGLAFSIFDDKMTSRPEFNRAWRPVGEPYHADTLEELAKKLGIPPAAFVKTVKDFNAAIQPGELDLDRKDGRHTAGITPPKSNWAMSIQTPPFTAVPVTGGVTFTFGGLKTNTSAQVISTSERIIPGLYAAGELQGEIYYYNYPGATSVIRGAVFGRISGKHAAQRAKQA
ncbi:MAG: FAD-dependent tricarballylate dehydrogenase TcuA [Chloroflexota bacterium]